MVMALFVQSHFTTVHERNHSWECLTYVLIVKKFCFAILILTTYSKNVSCSTHVHFHKSIDYVFLGEICSSLEIDNLLSTCIVIFC